jgi:ABC-2 type transport system permease protein
MRSYAEEFRQGTFETLTTAPVTDWQVVLSKFFGALSSIACSGRLPSFTLVSLSGSPKPMQRMPTAHTWAFYLLLLLMGMFFTSYGCLASSLVKDQINAAVICACGVFIWFFLPFLPEIMRITKPETLEFFRYFSAAEHMREFAKGVIDSRQVVWYLSCHGFDAVSQFHRLPTPQVEGLILTVLIQPILFMAEETLTEPAKPGSKNASAKERHGVGGSAW